MDNSNDVRPDQHIEEYVEVWQPRQDPYRKLADNRFSGVDLILPTTAFVPLYIIACPGVAHLVSFWLDMDQITVFCRC